MTKNIKYCHVVAKMTDVMEKAVQESPRRSGMYNWMYVHKGEMRAVDEMQKEDFEKYDVVQVNLSPVDQIIVPRIRRMLGNNSNTKLILNNDYVCEAWDGWNIHPQQFLDVQKLGDGLFGTEPYQTSNLIDGAFNMPHPTWTKSLKRYGRTAPGSRIKIGVMFHHWEKKHFLSASNIYQLRDELRKPVEAKLYGYMGPEFDLNARWVKSMWTKIMPMTDFPSFISDMSKNTMMYEPCTYHTYGRASVDSACIELPTVGSDRVGSMRRLWPNSCCDPTDGKKTRELMHKWLADKKWASEQLEFAYSNVDYYNYDNCRERYLKMLEEVDKRIPPYMR